MITGCPRQTADSDSVTGEEELAEQLIRGGGQMISRISEKKRQMGGIGVKPHKL